MLRGVEFFRAEQPWCMFFAGRWGMRFDLDDPQHAATLADLPSSLLAHVDEIIE
jgi:hypothetical protein